MASKYLQKYPVPAGFQEILHDFTREVLRDQPPNIIEYAAKYFEMLEKGKKFEYESKFNVKKDDRKNQLQYNPKAAEDITKKATAAVTKINAAADPPPKKVEEKPRITPRQTAAEEHHHDGPSIKHIGTGEPEQIHDKPLSTNTLIKDTGHSYVQDLSKKVQAAESEEPHHHSQEQETPGDHGEEEEHEQGEAEEGDQEGGDPEGEHEEGEEEAAEEA